MKLFTAIAFAFLTIPTTLPAGNHDASAAVFNIYAQSATRPLAFDGILATHVRPNLAAVRPCLLQLEERYGPLVRAHFDSCQSLPTNHRAACHTAAPPAVHAGNWVNDVLVAIGGTPWCATAAGFGICDVARKYGEGALPPIVEPFFGIYRQLLVCDG